MLKSLKKTGVWLSKNLFATPFDSLLTLFAFFLIALVLPDFIGWAFIKAQWQGFDRASCLTITQGGLRPEGWSGACWAFINAKIGQFIFGRYPDTERWRVVFVFILFIFSTVPFLIPRIRWKILNGFFLFFIFPIIAFFFLVGGVFNLSHVESSLWGGLMVTLIVSYVAIVISFPVGIFLALGRNSEMPVLRSLCIFFIETIRGVPIVTILFMATFMIPLLAPSGMIFERFMCIMIGVSLFASAYMAEVIRGGFLIVPSGQYETADSLGLGYWKKIWLVIFPQAVRHVIPGVVNVFIGVFKDTTLLLIVSVPDLLGIMQQNLSDINWATPQTTRTGYVFVGFVLWAFCFGMSLYSTYIERFLNARKT